MEMKYLAAIIVLVVTVSAFLANYATTGKAFKVIQTEEPTPSTAPVQSTAIVVQPSTRTSYIYSNGLNARYENGVLKYYHQDNLGSNSLATAAGGSESSEFRNDPYGEEMITEKSDVEESYKYTGKELDAETDLYYYGARYYDTDTGRFITVDPILRVGSNYAYAANNPMMMIDETGMAEDKPKDYNTYSRLNLGYDLGTKNPLTYFSLGFSHNDFPWLGLEASGGLGQDPFNQGRSFYGGEIKLDVASIRYRRFTPSGSGPSSDQYSLGISKGKLDLGFTGTTGLSSQGSYDCKVTGDTGNNYPGTLEESFSIGNVNSFVLEGSYEVFRKTVGKKNKYDFVLSPGGIVGFSSKTEPKWTGPTGIGLDASYRGGRSWFLGPSLDARFERKNNGLVFGVQIGALLSPKSQEGTYGLGLKPNGEPEAQLNLPSRNLIHDSLSGKVYFRVIF